MPKLKSFDNDFFTFPVGKKQIYFANTDYIKYINQYLPGDQILRMHVKPEYIESDDFDFYESEISIIYEGLNQFQGYLSSNRFPF